LSDTTYIATAGDRSYIAFGEGGVGIGARIMLWSANDAAISNQITVADIVSNASEQVLGLGLDSNGRIGVARGTESTYFFSNGIDGAGDLRLQGVFSDGVAGGQGGAALHPNHVYSAGSSPETLSFIATANRTIKIVDTFHFFERGEVAIRDQIVGQLRTSLPFPGDNAGLAPGDPGYILIKLYGVTDTGAVVIVPIRNARLVERPEPAGVDTCDPARRFGVAAARGRPWAASRVGALTGRPARRRARRRARLRDPFLFASRGGIPWPRTGHPRGARAGGA